MAERFAVSDWHLGEDRFEVMQRPFRTIHEAIETQITRHNELVKPEDWVYFLGDALYQNTPNPEVHLQQIERFNGRKILVRGNHDRPFTDEQFSPYFEQIVPEGEGIELDVEGIPCYLTHYPILGRPDRFNLVGHIHAAWKLQLNSLNVGVDVHHFYPTNLKRIPFYLAAVTQFYDNDVWVCYQPLNESFKGIRGKQSTYFTPVKK